MDAVERVARAICSERTDNRIVEQFWPNHIDEAQAALSAIHYAELLAVVEAARGLLNEYDPEDGTIHAFPDAHCLDCTSGTTPVAFGQKTCPLHTAQAALSALDAKADDAI